MFLATTSVAEFWDPDDTLLFLGPWCTRYDRKKDWQHRKHIILKNPWDDRDRLHSATGYCERVFEHLLHELTGYLNAVHATHYQSRYWRIIVGPWLLYYIHSMYSRYTYLTSAFDEYSGLSTRCLSQAEFTSPHNMEDFAVLLNQDRYNLQLFSMICFWLGVPCSMQSYLDREVDRSLISASVKLRKLIELWQKDISETAKGFVYSAINRICAWKRKPIVIVNPEISLGRRLGWNIHVGGRGSTGIFFILFKLDESYEAVFDRKRYGLRNLNAYDEFSRFLVNTFPLNVPTLYMEGYEKTRERALQRWDYTPQVCATSSAWYYNECFKYLAAEWSEKKCRLIALQHGGGYGVAKYAATEWHERSICDRFYSWGWSVQEEADGRVRDLPSPVLSAARSRPWRLRRAFSQVLLVGTSFPVYPFRLESLPQDSQIGDYVQWRIRFINALRAKSRESLLVRVMSTDCGWCEVERMRDACGIIQFDDLSVSLLDQLRRTRLAVFDHQTTGFLEALALNIPCILFWQPDYWEVREESVTFCRALSECGVLHHSPEKAAAKVMEVYDNPMSWWDSQPIQNARRGLVDRYALGRADWVHCWVNALEEEAALSSIETP